MGLFEASAELPKVGDVPKLGTAALRKALKTLRTKAVRQSKLVVVIGKVLLDSKADLGTEGNTILEQVAIAAFDVGDIQLGNECVAKLHSQFGDSSRRVKRLQGMGLEAEGRYPEAVKLYKSVLEGHPTDKSAVWRLVACAKAQGNLAEAASTLSTHLEVIHSPEGYLELLQLHLMKTNPDYEKATAACEELILADPTVHTWLLLHAELLLTQSKEKSKALLARKYFSEAILQCATSAQARPLWGLYHACETLSSAHTLTESEKAENSALFEWASKRLLSIYQSINSPAAEVSKRLLQSRNTK